MVKRDILCIIVMGWMAGLEGRGMTRFKISRPHSRSVTPDSGGGPRSVLRALEALKALARTGEGLSLAEMSKSMKVPKSSLFELMRALQSGGYIVNNRGLYQLGHGAAHLANLLGGRDHVALAARPFLLELAAETGEGAALIELHGERHVIFIDYVESSAPMNMRVARDALAPINCSSGGLSILAMRPEAEREAYIRSGYAEPYTPETVYTEAQLRAAFADVQKSGVAVTRNSMLEGSTGIAAPVFDMDGWACASIGVIGPNERVEARRTLLSTIVAHSAQRLSLALGCTRDQPGIAVDEAFTAKFQ